jgi:hypothetical protein
MNSFALIPILISALGASVLLCAWGVLRLVTQKRFKKSQEAVFSVLFVAMSALLFVDATQASDLFSVQAKVGINLCCLVLFSIGILFSFKSIDLRHESHPFWRALRTWILITLGASSIAWSYHRVQVRTAALNFTGTDSELPGEVALDNQSEGFTDNGTKIPLYRLDLTEEMFNEFVVNSESNIRPFEHAGVLRAAPDESANCHGWVFTAGQFLLKGSDVERILQDHQYSVVTDPRSQDLVIYRDVTGNILHTALVQAVLPDGTVIAESKWGTLQRFLHLPEDQPYSTIFQFYRTKRPDHLIHVQPQKARKSNNTESGKVLRTVASQPSNLAGQLARRA